MSRYLLLTYTWDKWHNKHHKVHNDEIDTLIKSITSDSKVIYEPNDAYTICTNIKKITPNIRELIKMLAEIKK